MKIEQQNLQQTGGAQQTGGSEQVKGGRATASSKGAYGLGSDSVELSSLSEAVRAFTTESPERTSSVEQLGRVVQNGTYQINSLEVSRGVIADAFLP